MPLTQSIDLGFVKINSKLPSDKWCNFEFCKCPGLREGNPRGIDFELAGLVSKKT